MVTAVTTATSPGASVGVGPVKTPPGNGREQEQGEISSIEDIFALSPLMVESLDRYVGFPRQYISSEEVNNDCEKRLRIIVAKPDTDHKTEGACFEVSLKDTIWHEEPLIEVEYRAKAEDDSRRPIIDFSASETQHTSFSRDAMCDHFAVFIVKLQPLMKHWRLGTHFDNFDKSSTKEKVNQLLQYGRYHVY